MTRGSTARLGILVIAVSALCLCLTSTSRPRGEALPDRLDDHTFWTLVNDFSEPGGTFRSDNLVSNELAFQQVIPRLRTDTTPASAYIGVGPDQNFTYIAALKPRIAFIVDIRRQNMLLHLMYKAIIERSPTRLEFLARLFSRKPRADVAAVAGPDELLAAFQGVEPSALAFERTRQDIRATLQAHGFDLTAADFGTIDYVFGAFYSAGPDIRYSFGRGNGWQPFPNYRDLMVEKDLDGVQRSYVASEDLYGTLRDFELRNLVVPIVGDFAGPKALRSVGRYLEVHRATVSVFYTSNVEQYLFRGDLFQHFYGNVAALPIDSRSTFVRAYFLNQGRPFRIDPGQPQTLGPRSEQLLNPIHVLLAAFSEGRIGSYFDVIDLSRQ
ncbi:MAG TPA: hypothetical protein VGI12_00465 [Vicinamibacterales bacterium]|jgi:hypothetical protein